jgi:molybdate transport system substrate-binding protein
MMQRRHLLLGGAALAGVARLRPALAAESLRVISSGGFAAALKVLAPQFERESGIPLDLGWGPSMGTTVDAVPTRLARGEALDVLIMVGYALDDLIKQGKVLADSRVVLARSGIGVVVKAGAPHPDVSTPEALKAALLAAKSVAWSDSASGVYIQNEMLAKLGVAQALAGKGRMIPAEPVGAVVARGEAEIGFQQISELKPVKGIDLVGPLPPPLQKITQFSAGIVTGSPRVAEARKLLAYLASPEARAAITDSGLEPGEG